MRPSILLQIFRRTGTAFTPRGWMTLGGLVAASVFFFTLILRWR